MKEKTGWSVFSSPFNILPQIPKPAIMYFCMTHIPDNYYRLSVKALILDEHKRFLLLKEENGKWDIPGGGLDYGEDPEKCLIRELKEEAGLTVTSVKQLPCYFVTGKSDSGAWKANILYQVEVQDLNFTPSDECVDLRFFTKEEAMQEPIYSTVEEFANQFQSQNH